MQTFANTTSTMLKKRAERYMVASLCPVCKGKRLRKESLSVKFAGYDIYEIGGLTMERLYELLMPYTKPDNQQLPEEKRLVIQRITEDVTTRLSVLLRLGLGYLSLDRSTPTLSPGELQRLRLATQVRANLFGVVYVLDEPSAGLHPADTEALLEALDALKAAGNSLFVVEHDLNVIRHADWIVDVGPGAGQNGGEIIYSGELSGLVDIKKSITRKYLFQEEQNQSSSQRNPTGWLQLKDVTRNNLHGLNAKFPLGVFTTVTGVSGSGKSSLVSQALIELVSTHLGHEKEVEEKDIFSEDSPATLSGDVIGGLETITRLVQVDQKSIGRTPRSNLATYTGMFDHVRKIFAGTDMARQRKYDAGRFSFNVAKGRCPNCEGEGFVMIELLFLPSVYSPCPVCHGTRYNNPTLEITYNKKNIADVLNMTVDQAHQFFSDEMGICKSLTVLKEVGLGYLRLGQPATELSGGEAQRIKLATELQRVGRGNTLYILDEPTTGLHPHDIVKLMTQLHGLVNSGNTVIVVEHNMRVAAGSDWVIDMGPGAGEKGGKILVQGRPVDVAAYKESVTAKYLRRQLDEALT